MNNILSLYDDQKQKLNELWQALQIHNKILFQACTGAGKTIMANALINKLVEQGKKIAFIVDREELVNQSYNTFDKVNVSIVKAGQDKDFDADKPIQIVMIHTFYARRDKLPDMDLTHIIIDEVHNNWDTGRINSLLKIYSDAKVIGLTATPCCAKGWLLNGFDHYIEGLQAKELIKLGRLCPTVDYVFESYVNTDNIATVNGDYDSKEIDEQVLDINKVEKIVEEWERLAIDRKTLVFANSIKHSTALWQEFVKRGHKFELLHSQNNNRDCIDRLKASTIQGVVNVSITIAGFDCPDISCIVNARPSKIERILRQALGRGRRTAVGKVDNLHLDFANYVANFGCTDDDRYYQARPPKNDEPLFVCCPECGNIQPIEVKECSICGYDLSIIIEKSKGKIKQSKKDLERLVIIKSMQDDLYNSLLDLVLYRGYKRGYAFYLYKDLLMNAKSQGTGLKFYSKILNRIEKCKNGKTSEGKEFSPRWLLHQ